MLGFFRGFLNTWAARAFFLLLVGSFVLWGVNDVVRSSGGAGSDAAVVGGDRISPLLLADAYRNQVNQIAQMTNNRPLAAEEKARIAQLTLEQLIQNALVERDARDLGLAAPDGAVREAIRSIPAFRGANGQFNRAALDGWLRNNGMTEARMVEIVRAGLLRDQLMAPLRSGVAAPDALLRTVYAFQNQTRVAATVSFPLDAAPEPAAPTEAELKELYDDNPGAYSAPEYRRIRAVILSPDTIARGVEVGDADIAAAYEANRSRYVQGEKRAADVLIAPDAATALRLAEAWRRGADWAAMEKAAADAGAAAVQVSDAAVADYPAPEVGRAVFAATPDEVTGPAPGPGGQVLVLRVTHVTPPRNESLADAHDAIRDALARERGTAQLADRKEQLETELASVSRLEELPAGLSVAPLVGTLDAAGNTPDGTPAPIPGPPALRDAIVAAAFRATRGALPVLQDGPDQASFAVEVEDTSPPKLKPFAEVREQLADDFEAAARRRVQDKAATALLVAAQKSNLEDAAAVAGLRVVRSAPLRREGPATDVPVQLLQPLFALRKGEVTTVETPEGFVVASPVEVTDPAPDADPAAASRLRTALNKALADDMEVTYVNALRGRVQPVVNRQVLEAIAQ